MSLISDLTIAGIIDAQDAIALTKPFEDCKDGKTSPLQQLFLFFFSKVTGHPANRGFMFSMNVMDIYNGKRPKEDTTSYEAMLFLLRKYNLIDALVYDKLKLFPWPGNNYSYLGALYLAGELSEFYEHFTTKNQVAFLQLLNGKDGYHRQNMIHHSKKDKLVKDIKDGKIETYLDFFKYCYCCNFLNIPQTYKQPQKLIEKLTKILNRLIDGAFKITAITYKEEDSVDDSGYDNRKVNLLIDTGARKHIHGYTYSVTKGRKAANPSLILENALVLVNKILEDYNCTYRFTCIVSRADQYLFPGSRNKYVVCRIEQENAHIFDFRNMEKTFLHARPTHVFFQLPLSYTHIEYTLYDFKACGLLSHLKQSQLNDTKKIFGKTYKTIGNLISVFPNTLIAVNQYTSRGQKPNLTFLQQLSVISKGLVRFEDIKDGLPDEFDYSSELTYNVSFKFNNKQHELDCRLTSNCFDYSIIYYVVNNIIKKDYPGYQLIEFTSENFDESFFLFATNQQSSYLQEMNLRQAIDRFLE